MIRSFSKALLLASNRSSLTTRLSLPTISQVRQATRENIENGCTQPLRIASKAKQFLREYARNIHTGLLARCRHDLNKRINRHGIPDVGRQYKCIHIPRGNPRNVRCIRIAGVLALHNIRVHLIIHVNINASQFEPRLPRFKIPGPFELRATHRGARRQNYNCRACINKTNWNPTIHNTKIFHLVRIRHIGGHKLRPKQQCRQEQKAMLPYNASPSDYIARKIKPTQQTPYWQQPTSRDCKLQRDQDA